MTLTEITNTDSWEVFQRQHSWAQFTQSWAWGEFRKSLGCEVRRWALLDDHGTWLAAAQLEYRRKFFGVGYWFSPRGPVFWSGRPAGEDAELLREFISQLQDRNARSGICTRLEPVLLHTDEDEKILPPAAVRTAQLNPACTLTLDLTQTEDELLAGMHQKTRYNIRVAERHGVRVRLASSPADLDIFLHLAQETSKRDGFVQHEGAYLGASFQALAAARMGRLRFAEFEGRVLAASMEVAYGDTLTYLHGASSSEERHRMAPFALHWQAIRDAKQEGYRIYDFWGMNPHSKTSFAYKTSFEGITRFKRGWGGKEICLVGTWDIPRYPRAYRFLFRHR